MLQQVAVVQGAQAKVLDTQGAFGVDGVIELARMRFNELQQPFVDDADIETRANRLRERIDALRLDFLIDEFRKARWTSRSPRIGHQRARDR